MDSRLILKNIYKRYSAKAPWVVNDFSLDIAQGELLALLGESGSGKTTLLRILAGFEIPEKGEIVLNGQTLANDRTFVKPEKRAIGMVFQDYALFPHLTVAQNILYGLKQKKSAQSRQRLEEVLALVGLPNIGKRYPHQLSGGQQQRVALARALAPQPSVLMLDEPFSNLDEVLKDQIREDMRQIIKKSGITAILVTHDTKDALAMADRIAVMQGGRLLQADVPKVLYDQPAHQYVGNFFGKMNWIKVRDVVSNDEGCTVVTQLNRWQLAQAPAQRPAYMGVRPEAFRLANGTEGKLVGKVQKITYLGNCQQLEVLPHATENPAEATPLLVQLAANVALTEGQTIGLEVAEECFCLI